MFKSTVLYILFWILGQILIPSLVVDKLRVCFKLANVMIVDRTINDESIYNRAKSYKHDYSV